MVLLEILFSGFFPCFFLREFLSGCLVTDCGFPPLVSPSPSLVHPVLGIDDSLQPNGNSLCFPLCPFTVCVLLDHRRLSWLTC